MAKFIDIRDWNEKPFFNTKGTRNKCVVNDPSENVDYYFKTSIKKEEKNYKAEFWSEIIASEVGRFLGFNVLEYNIAQHENEVGCISRSMNTTEECLTEGIGLLTGYDNTYNPEEKKSYSTYTFQFIKKALLCHGQGIQPIINTIIFDSLIGNSDRHQENWGYITPYKILTDKQTINLFKKVLSNFKKTKIILINQESTDSPNVRLLAMVGEYSPIYDSGCCLAREKSEDDIKKMLQDSIMFESFINRGKSEIRWGRNGNKINHFELIKNIREEHPKEVFEEINKVIQRYNLNKIRDIVFYIDRELPEKLKAEFGLSTERKELICKLIDNRFGRLKETIL